MNLEENRVANHLINEKSPYLLQHAYNPVDWFPWGEEAFAKAKAENKPIFLSIGYSTCHWCHVMERESFEDIEVAEVLNRSYVSIKVDKEERPDVDSIYMTVCTSVNGHGGWPLTIIMTPEQKPFFVATYLPKHSNGHMTGMMELLQQIEQLWKNDQEKARNASSELTKAIKEHLNTETSNSEQVKASILGVAYHNYRRMFDTKYGGFGDAPKFPTPHNLLYLLRYAKRFQSEGALAMVEETLQHMYRGGIYDHVGGGFARYSTDETWLVPHFEKMLYDNALLAMAFTEAYQMTKRPIYKKIIEEIFAYIEREMMSEEGGFYCAQDADSEGEEGKYYTFTPKEVKKVLGEEAGAFYNERYDITELGNFEGKSIPNLIQSEELELPEEKLETIELAKYKLMEYRRKRTKLHKDDKILTSWNALMIAAYAKAYQVFMNEEYLNAAIRAYEFLDHNLSDDKGRLFIRYRDGASVGVGVLDDYAFLCLATYELYEATYEPKYLAKSISLMKCMIKHFWDKKDGGFYFSANDGEQLILRPKELYDGAIPSGNSVAAYMLCRLSRMTGDDELTKIREEQLRFMASPVNDYPNGYSFALLAYLEEFSEGAELITVVNSISEAKAVQLLLKENYEPDLCVIQKVYATSEKLEQIIPYLADYKQTEERPTYYVCKNHACHEPFHEISKLIPTILE